MARIRSIKPEFFRHRRLFIAEQETGLPLRVAFAGLWTVADREGRFRWEPDELKLDCLPYDEVDFSRVLDALTTRGFLVRYASQGRHYGFIPGFTRHQIINNRESASILPPPSEVVETVDDLTRHPRVEHASSTRHDLVQGEGKGREGKGRGKEESPPTPSPAQKRRSPDDPAVIVAKAFIEAKDARWPEYADRVAPRTTLETIAQQHIDAGGTAELLKEVIQTAITNWKNPSPPTTLDALRNTITDKVAAHRRSVEAAKQAPTERRQAASDGAGYVPRDEDAQWRTRLQGFARKGFWLEGRWGPEPGKPGCQAPRRLITEVLPDLQPAKATGSG